MHPSQLLLVKGGRPAAVWGAPQSGGQGSKGEAWGRRGEPCVPEAKCKVFQGGQLIIWVRCPRRGSRGRREGTSGGRTLLYC